MVDAFFVAAAKPLFLLVLDFLLFKPITKLINKWPDSKLKRALLRKIY
ncbi:MAG: hypothetical protein ACXWAT_00110 [Methylobacter sp.]